MLQFVVFHTSTDLTCKYALEQKEEVKHGGDTSNLPSELPLAFWPDK
jgi:hypothetical protein